MTSVAARGVFETWNRGTGVTIRLRRAPHFRPRRNDAVAYSPDGTRLAAAGDDQCIHVWENDSRCLVASIPTGTGKVFGLSFSPDGERIAAATSGGVVGVWEAADARAVSTLSGHNTRCKPWLTAPTGRGSSR